MKLKPNGWIKLKGYNTSMEMPKIKTTIILGKNAVKDVLEALSKNHDDECFYCGAKITVENFGCVTAETGLVCNHIFCAMDFFADYGNKHEQNTPAKEN